MITTILLLALFLTVFLQPNAGRLMAACIFSGVTLVYDGISGGLDGAEYYIGASLADLIMIIMLSGINPLPRLAMRLQYLCMASIALNFLGWMAWFLYFPPTVYDGAFVVLYAVALYVLLKKDKCDVGGYTVSSWFTRFRFNPRARSVSSRQNKGPL